MCDSIAAHSLVKTIAAIVLIMLGAVAEVASLECHMPLEFIMETGQQANTAIRYCSVYLPTRRCLVRRSETTHLSITYEKHGQCPAMTLRAKRPTTGEGQGLSQVSQVAHDLVLMLATSGHLCLSRSLSRMMWSRLSKTSFATVVK